MEAKTACQVLNLKKPDFFKNCAAVNLLYKWKHQQNIYNEVIIWCKKLTDFPDVPWSKGTIQASSETRYEMHYCGRRIVPSANVCERFATNS